LNFFYSASLFHVIEGLVAHSHPAYSGEGWFEVQKMNPIITVYIEPTGRSTQKVIMSRHPLEKLFA
jgi:hypothetical protein